MWETPVPILLVLALFTFAVEARQEGTDRPAGEIFIRGEAVYTYWCATCHSAGPGMPGTQALQAKYAGEVPAVLTDRTDLTKESVSFFVRNGVSVMPFFRKTEVSDADLDALAEYLVNRPRGE